MKKNSDGIFYSMCAMALRHDERLKMAADRSVKYDDFQVSLIKRVYMDENSDMARRMSKLKAIEKRSKKNLLAMKKKMSLWVVD